MDLGPASGPHKYGAEPITLDGIRFASKLEADTYAELKLLERAGEIRNLELQVPLPIVVNGVTVGKYVADFAFFEDNKRVIVGNYPVDVPIP